MKEAGDKIETGSNRSETSNDRRGVGGERKKIIQAAQSLNPFQAKLMELKKNFKD